MSDIEQKTGLVPYELHEQARQAARSRIPAPARRRIPGKARSHEEALREYDEHRDKLRAAINQKFPDPDTGSTDPHRYNPLWEFWAPYADDEKPVRWRLQLECGHTAETYTLSPDKLPLGPHASNLGDDLIEGEYTCPDKDCRVNWRQTPLQDVAAWGARADDVHLTPEPEDQPDWWSAGDEAWAKYRDKHNANLVYSQWHVTLTCGHAATITADLGWKPEDGIARQPVPDPDPEREARRQWLVASGDRESARLAAEGFPEPTPWEGCHTCAVARRIVAFEYLGALVPGRKPAGPADPAAALQKAIRAADRQSREASREAERLRRQLAQLQAKDDDQDAGAR